MRRWTARPPGVGAQRGADWDLRKRPWRERRHLGGDGPGPLAVGVRGLQVAVDLLGDPIRELAEQVVGHERAFGSRQDRRRRECIEPVERALANRRPIDRQQARDLVIAVAALQHHLQDGALVGRQLVKGTHRVQSVVERVGGTGRRARYREPGCQAPIRSPRAVATTRSTGSSCSSWAPSWRARGSPSGRTTSSRSGIVHGGIYAAIAEGLASYATVKVVLPQGKIASGMSNQASFLRPISGGTIHATAVRKHAGRTTWVWEVEMQRRSGSAVRAVAGDDGDQGPALTDVNPAGERLRARAQARTVARGISTPALMSSAIASRRSSASNSRSGSAS